MLKNLPVFSSAKSTADTSQNSAQEAATTTDKVELSGWKDEVASLKERIRSIPEVDEDRVARVKQAIDSGTYTADGKKVARSILKNQLLDEIA